MPNVTPRSVPPQAFDTLTRHGLHPVLARIYAARGIAKPDQLETELSLLIPFERLKNITMMATLLADAIAAGKRLLIVADYDSDGATACAVGMRALREFGATVDYLVPNRFEYGYGLTPEIVRLAADVKHPDILITVDNGIASVEGVDEANRLGMQVLITDHHLPGDALPDAAAIVNPNQPGCDFPSKNLAGVGVMFYLMLALRAELRLRGAFVEKNNSAPPLIKPLTNRLGDQNTIAKPLVIPDPPPTSGEGRFVSATSGRTIRMEPNLASLLDLVALGTVADVVKLDDNNRILVQQGLQRIRKGRGCAGINALLQVARRDFRQASTYDLGFMLGPRLNAAGRLDDMALGIECLITDDEAHAAQIALELDALNRQRREIEAGMQDSALAMLTTVFETQNSKLKIQNLFSLSLFDPGWHQGVIGILASRMKDKFHRPVVAFAPGNQGEIKGSGRSIAGFHLRDALDLVSKRHPGLLLKFGGHAAAAGLTLRSDDFEKFRDAFELVAQTLLTPADLTRIIETDGDLDESDLSLELAQRLAQQVWGQGFPQPAFSACFLVKNQRVVGEKHLRLRLCKQESNCLYDAMLFFHNDPLPETIDAVYRLEVNEFNGKTGLQLILIHWSASHD